MYVKYYILFKHILLNNFDVPGKIFFRNLYFNKDMINLTKLHITVFKNY